MPKKTKEMRRTNEVFQDLLCKIFQEESFRGCLLPIPGKKSQLYQCWWPTILARVPTQQFRQTTVNSRGQTVRLWLCRKEQKEWWDKESAAFPEESRLDQQIYLSTPTVSSESLESLNLNRNTFRSESSDIHEDASKDLDVEGTESSEQLRNEISILTNKFKMLQSKLSKHREDKRKIKRVKQRLSKSFCHCNIL